MTISKEGFLTGARPTRVPSALGPSREVLGGGGAMWADRSRFDRQRLLPTMARLLGPFSVAGVAEHHWRFSRFMCPTHVEPPRLPLSPASDEHQQQSTRSLKDCTFNLCGLSFHWEQKEAARNMMTILCVWSTQSPTRTAPTQCHRNSDRRTHPYC